MKHVIRTTAALIALFILAACKGRAEAPPTPTLMPTPGQAPSSTPAPEQEAAPSETPETDSSPAPAATSQDAGEPASGGPVIYLVALEDGGEQGEEIGCGDSLVPVPVDLPSDADPVEGVYEALLTETGQGEQLYNALIQSDLQVDGYQIEDGEAIIALSGQFTIGGTCDVPRVRAQLEETALQFEGVDSVQILINGDPLNAYLAGEPSEEVGPQSAAGAQGAQIYLIALEDDGASGEPVGCGDSLVPVEVQLGSTPTPLEDAMKALLAVKDEFYGQSGLYNALHMSELRFEQAIIYDDGTAVIDLSGAVEFGGECDLPRFKAQLEATATQFDTVDRAAIFINGQPLDIITGQMANEPTDTTVDEIQLFFIAEGDNGESGRAIGCGDSVVPVTLQIEPTNQPITTALEMLLAVDNERYGQSGLLNALAGDSLSVDGVDVGEDGTALVTLTGKFQLAGTCDGPRVEAQLVDTVTQFDGVNDAVILINERPLSDILDMR
jgi:spore germination protein GerM/predicted small lipoprotein YifL